jgi:hypothetical protein
MPGKPDVCNYYTQGFVPGGREWVPNFWEMLPGKCEVSMPAIVQARFALSMSF